MNPFANFSVMSYSFHGLLRRGAINVFGYLETAKYRYGLGTADIWNGLITSYDDDYITILKQNIDERGLAVVNLCCDGTHIWDNDPETRAANESLAWKCLNLAEKIGARTIRIDAGVREDVFSAEQTDYTAKKYREYCKRAAAFGAKLGTENHWGATRFPANVEKLFAAVNEANFGLLLHLGNWAEGDKDANDRAFAKRAMHTHIDFEHCADAERVLPPLQAGGYSGCWSVESHKSTNEYNNVAFQLAQVKRVICPMDYR
ncbi:MAG: sugar phosphate isomerase/epimerase [Treponema sp.]|jgi:sugar phosphate isomerase/epimerase|nr:sugar phosphate isomerase/epimerase [Treponema sp.]